MTTNAQTQPPAALAAFHSPTPYYLAVSSYLDGDCVTILGADSLLLARLPKVTISNAKDDMPESLATGAFIVRACNSHAALVAALERSESELTTAHAHLLSLHSRNIDRSAATSLLCDGTLIAAAQARAALQSAKE